MLTKYAFLYCSIHSSFCIPTYWDCRYHLACLHLRELNWWNRISCALSLWPSNKSNSISAVMFWQLSFGYKTSSILLITFLVSFISIEDKPFISDVLIVLNGPCCRAFVWELQKKSSFPSSSCKSGGFVLLESLSESVLNLAFLLTWMLENRCCYAYMYVIQNNDWTRNLMGLIISNVNNMFLLI